MTIIAMVMAGMLAVASVCPDTIGFSVARGGEIGTPLADPKFPVSVISHTAKRQTQGSLEATTLTGGVRIFQGGFVLIADEAVVWSDPSKATAVEEEQVFKYIVEARGHCEVKFGDGQSLFDDQWKGRLFSHFDLETRADVWVEPKGPPPDLTKPSVAPKQSEVQPAIQWTARDNAMHVQLAAQFMAQLPSSDAATSQPGIIINNPGMGGTVLDGGNMPPPPGLLPPAIPFNANSPPSPPREPENVSAFQIGAAPVGPPGNAPGPFAPAPLAAPVAATAPGVSLPRRVGAKNFAFSGRGGIVPAFEAISRPDRGDSVVTLTGGVRLNFSDVSIAVQNGVMDLGTVLIEADRVVLWTVDANRLVSGQVGDMPVEVYLEGNVIFQQGARRVYAERMYYNVQSEYGMILGAEVLTDAPQYDGIVRLKADVVQQRSRENFLAHQAALTSSRLGVPRYWLQADSIELTDRSQDKQLNFFTRMYNRQPATETGMKARARNNFVYIEGFPVFYWPVLDTNVDTSGFYLTGLKVRNDQIFGNQVMLDWNLYQILGIQAIDGTKWTFSTDYLEKRGIGLGTNFNYNVPSNWIGNNARGFVDAWGLRDKGLDILGRDRVNLTPEEENRGRLLLRHRQNLGSSADTELWGEVGWISDRNFQEQYFEQEWDTQKDAATALRMRQYLDNQMLDIWGQVQLNDFHTESSWLPRLDHYWLGQTLGPYLTYYSHTNVGYARIRTASTPTNASEAAVFQLQPGEVNASGVQATTKHEIDLPIDTGISKIVPFLAGEVSYYGEDINGESLTRLTGQAGWRSSTPLWKVYPDVQSPIFNLNGLAHKMSFESQFLYADSNKDLDQLPLYDPIDDNTQEHFRRRLVFNTFGGTLPLQFESQEYAARQSMQRYVSAASNNIVADQLQSRAGLHQRLQTKRGIPGQERIADVIEFDVDAILFGKADRDNFGETIGGINYDFRYHIGDRFTIVSDGYYDLFEEGLKATTIGGVISRPGRGEAYLGVTSLEGPISSTLLTTSVNYRMNEKWLANGGVSYDFSSTGNIGQSFAVTRIGESFLFRVGATYDYGRDNVSLQFAFEPRFFQRQGLGVAGGQVIAPAGQYGLE